MSVKALTYAPLIHFPRSAALAPRLDQAIKLNVKATKGLLLSSTQASDAQNEFY
jgi:hypothetical protein